VAPDIVFEIEFVNGSAFYSEGKTHPESGLTNPQLSTGKEKPLVKPSRLSELRSAYTLVVFGASWCPSCQSELTQLSSLYSNWKQLGVEVLFVSLDEKPDEFRNYVRNFPFMSYCDYRKWQSPAAIDYHVFATPTLYLLDSHRKIILRPTSVRQVDAWVDWYLVKKNALQ